MNKKTINIIENEYEQTGASKHTNKSGMREMQQRVYEKRNSKHLLIKAPPASGKSRALMFVALDKLQNQGIKKVIVAVPETSIGASFFNTKLTENGFFTDWVVEEEVKMLKCPHCGRECTQEEIENLGWCTNCDAAFIDWMEEADRINKKRRRREEWDEDLELELSQ